MDARSQMLTLGKGILGVGVSTLAALFSPGGDDALREIAVILGIMVSFMTLLNLMWSLMYKLQGRKDKQNE